MGEAVVVSIWTRIKVLPSSLYSAHHQSVQFLFVTVFCGLSDLKKKSNLYMSWRRVRDLSMDAENTSIGFKMREKLRMESDCFSVS
jgi:hypothetical protein